MFEPNDLELSEAISKINRACSELNRLVADKNELALFNALEIIHDHTKRAMFRLNDFRFKHR